MPKEKQAARKTLAKAVRYGRIVRPDACQKCGAITEIHGHHPDYSKPLEVEWLCRSCHTDAHRGDARRHGGRRSIELDPELLEAMQATQAQFAESAAVTNALRDERDCMIREALKDGWTHADIARATGLTRGRVGQLAMQNQ
jgi:hypothetical protein